MTVIKERDGGGEEKEIHAVSVTHLNSYPFFVYLSDRSID